MTSLWAPTRPILASSRADDGSTSRRIIALIVAAGCAAVLGVAAWLTPSSSGVGTHAQLNLPGCPWIIMADLPCPTCGMTTAFAHAAEGHMLASFNAQPLGFLLALAMAMAFLVSVHVIVTGSRLGGVFAKLWTIWTGWVLAGLVLAAWGYKIASHRGWL